MSESTLVKPDLEFVRELKSLGGDSLKKCFQCATCSVVCKRSPEDKPFPRKEMIWSQWGLKDRLMADPDVWLCYNCNDCSVHCPRGAKPGEVLAAVRNYSFMNYAWPSFMGKLLSQPKYLPFLFGLPIVLILLAVLGKQMPEGEILFRNFIPYIAIDITAGFFVLVLLFSLVTGVRALWLNLNKGPVRNSGAIPLGEAIKNVIMQILRHDNFKDCEANQPRYLAHLMIFYGFVACFVATAISGGFIWATELHLIATHDWLPPWSPLSIVKILGNLGGVAILVGCILVLINRSSNKEKAGEPTFADTIFTWVVVLTVATGFLTQFARWADATSLSYLLYSIHLVFIFYLIAYLPYSKFAHMAYRTVALIYAEKMGRKRK